MDRHQRNTLSGNEVRAALTLGSRSHVGMKRSTNQDAFCAMVGGNAPPGTDALLAVADGMGGHQAGEVASDMAIRGLVAKLSQSGAVAQRRMDTPRRFAEPSRISTPKFGRRRRDQRPGAWEQR